jgi:hypothetical protein
MIYALIAMYLVMGYLVLEKLEPLRPMTDEERFWVILAWPWWVKHA